MKGEPSLVQDMGVCILITPILSKSLCPGSVLPLYFSKFGLMIRDFTPSTFTVKFMKTLINVHMKHKCESVRVGEAVVICA